MNVSEASRLVTAYPAVAEPWRQLGVAHFRECGNGPEHYAEALACMEHSLELAPDSVMSVLGLAAASSLFCDDVRCLAMYERAHAMLKVGDPLVAMSEALALIRMGKWKEGYVRFEGRSIFDPNHHFQSHTPAEIFDQDRILIRPEQGFGDVFQYARYIPILAMRLGSRSKIYLECRPQQLSLFRLGFIPPVTVIGPDEATALIEAHPEMPKVGIMSLPYLLEMWEPAPQQLTFLHNAHPGAPKPNGIGLCWMGGKQLGNADAISADRRRSVPLEVIMPVGEALSDNIVQLQIGTGFMPEDWLATAHHILAKCGLVITVDTSVAHMAASLGVETWMLNRFDSCWRWGLTGRSTPWYPSMEIFRQPSPGAWEPVIGEVIARLQMRKRNAP